MLQVGLLQFSELLLKLLNFALLCILIWGTMPSVKYHILTDFTIRTVGLLLFALRAVGRRPCAVWKDIRVVHIVSRSLCHD